MADETTTDALSAVSTEIDPLNEARKLATGTTKFNLSPDPKPPAPTDALSGINTTIPRNPLADEPLQFRFDNSDESLNNLTAEPTPKVAPAVVATATDVNFANAQQIGILNPSLSTDALTPTAPSDPLSAVSKTIDSLGNANGTPTKSTIPELQPVFEQPTITEFKPEFKWSPTAPPAPDAISGINTTVPLTPPSPPSPPLWAAINPPTPQPVLPDIKLHFPTPPASEPNAPRPPLMAAQKPPAPEPDLPAAVTPPKEHAPTPALDDIIKNRDVIAAKHTNQADPKVTEIQENLVKTGVAVKVNPKEYEKLTKGHDGLVRVDGKIALNEGDLGHYGKQTEAAVHDFQEKSGILKPDGKVGRATAVGLKEAANQADVHDKPLVGEDGKSNPDTQRAVVGAVTNDLMDHGVKTKLTNSVKPEVAHDMQAPAATPGGPSKAEQVTSILR